MIVTFSRPAAYIMWALLGLYGERRYCPACDKRVTPRTVGGFYKLEDDSVGAWHSSLPCVLALSHYIKNSRTSAENEDILP